MVRLVRWAMGLVIAGAFGLATAEWTGEKWGGAIIALLLALPFAYAIDWGWAKIAKRVRQAHSEANPSGPRLSPDQKSLIAWAYQAEGMGIAERTFTSAEHVHFRFHSLYAWEVSSLGEEPSENKDKRLYWLALAEGIANAYFVYLNEHLLRLNADGIILAQRLGPPPPLPTNEFAVKRAEQRVKEIELYLSRLTGRGRELLESMSRASIKTTNVYRIDERSLHSEPEFILNSKVVGWGRAECDVWLAAIRSLKDNHYLTIRSAVSGNSDEIPTDGAWDFTGKAKDAMQQMQKRDVLLRKYVNRPPVQTP